MAAPLTARTGPSIREFLRYYVLLSLRRRRRTADAIIKEISKGSACNQEYRPTGELVVDADELDRVLRHLARQNLIAPSARSWRLTRGGRSKLASYDELEEKSEGSKERAARILLRWLHPPRAGRILDVGTGDGYLALRLAEKGCRVLGIDSAMFEYSRDSIKMARQKARAEGRDVEFREISVAGLRREKTRFDYVVASQAIHCMQNQPSCIQAIHDLLRPGGVFLCMDLHVGLKGFLEHGWHTFLAVSEEEWAELLPQSGFEEPAFRRTGGFLVVKARKEVPRCVLKQR